MRIPTPSPYAGSDITWKQCLRALRDIPNTATWLIRDVLLTTAVLCDKSRLHPTIRSKLKKALRKCVKPPYLTASDGSLAKTKALLLLELSGVDKFGRRPVGGRVIKREVMGEEKGAGSAIGVGMIDMLDGVYGGDAYYPTGGRYTSSVSPPLSLPSSILVDEEDEHLFNLKGYSHCAGLGYDHKQQYG